jgi:hypothetical protein
LLRLPIFSKEEDGKSKPMQGENKTRWMELAAQAAVEQDPVKLLRLLTEINKLLMEKEERLLKNQQNSHNTGLPSD